MTYFGTNPKACQSFPWKTVKDYEEITFKVHEGVARIAFNRPEVRNAFTPKTVDELWEALITCHESQDIGVVLITGEGPSSKDGDGRSAAVAIKMSGPTRATRARMGELIPTSP